jgi:hypothetical protein
MNKKAIATLKFAYLTLNLALSPIGLNVTSNYKAKNNCKYLCVWVKC